MKTAILTPLPEELSFLIQSLESFGLEKTAVNFGVLNAFEFPELNLLVAHGGHGKAQFGIQAQYLFCCEPQIESLICVGAAGALSESLNVGDVVVATETIEHDYNLKFVSRPLPRFSGDLEFLSCLEKLPELDFSVHLGAIASGDEDVIEVDRGRELAELTGAIAVAWEGAGGARACKFSQKRFLELRGITDTANHNAAADFEMNLAITMNHLAKLISISLKP